MTIYCKVIEGSIVARERKDNPVSKIVNGEPVWRELIEVGPHPAFDRATHHAPTRIETIRPTKVIQVWMAAVAKSQAELNAERAERRANAEARSDQPDTVDNLHKKMLFVLSNKIRLLEGNPARTWNAFNTWYKGQF